MAKTDLEKLNLSPKTEEEIKNTASHKNSKKQSLKRKQDSESTIYKEKITTKKKNNNNDDKSILKNPVASPIWLSISEAAKIGGVNTKTIRRAIQSEKIKYTIYKNRYLIGLRSLIVYLHSNTKLKNKLNFSGIGQYIKKWR